MAFRDPFSKMSLRAFVFWLAGGITLASLLLMLSNSNQQPRGQFYRHILANNTKDSSFSIPTFKVKKDVLYQIKVQNRDISSSWMMAGLSLLDEDDQVINEKEMEFWHESGYDPEDGSWSEGNYAETFNFKAMKDGKLSAEIYWMESKTGNFIPQSYRFTFKVTETGTRLIAHYFQIMFATFFSITILLMFFWRKARKV